MQCIQNTPHRASGRTNCIWYWTGAGMLWIVTDSHGVDGAGRASGKYFLQHMRRNRTKEPAGKNAKVGQTYREINSHHTLLLPYTVLLPLYGNEPRSTELRRCPFSWGYFFYSRSGGLLSFRLCQSGKR
jgi:hypothetical protein